jgi:DNA-binding NarL/FixJ family response regulator
LAQAPERRPITLLHLEDSSSDALLVRRRLRLDLPGISVLSVATELDFKRALAQKGIHVIVSDLSMPLFDGLAALEFSRQNYPLVPFIVLSANEDAKTVRAALRSGASDYLFKTELEDLARSIISVTGSQDDDLGGMERLASRARVLELSAQLLREKDFTHALRKVLEVAVALVKADRGNVLIFEEAENLLRNAISIGFPQEFMDRYPTIQTNAPTACARAFRGQERVVVENIHRDPDFSKLGDTVCESFGFTAVQATPLRGRNGRMLGILSTHYDRPYSPPAEDLQTLDLYIHEAEQVFNLLGAP